jgi:hypothetical protein
VIQAIRKYLVLLNHPAKVDADGVADLAHALDRLACASHATRAHDLESNAIPPAIDASAIRRRAQTAFPTLGYYACVCPEPVSNAAITVGDAIEDIVEIAAELASVEWRWRNTSEADAIAHYNFGFHTHWGRHLLNLRSYLHQSIFNY